MEKGILAKNVIAYPAIETNRDKLIEMFHSMKTSSNDDRFQFIRQWYGTDEVEPIRITEGLAAEMIANEANATTDAKVLLTAGGELQEAVQDGSKVSNGL